MTLHLCAHRRQVGAHSRSSNWPGAIVIASSVLAAFHLVHILYESRGRYREMAFVDYYRWWAQFAGGVNPWTAGAHPCNYPPFFVAVFAPLSFLSQPTAYWLWQAIELAAAAATLFLIAWRLPNLTVAKLAAMLVTYALLEPYLIKGTLYEGEPTLLLLALALAAWLLARDGRACAAGLMIALAALLKIYPALAGGFFLFRRRFKVVFWGVLWAVAGILMTGPARWSESLFNGAASYFKLPDWTRDERAVAILLNAYAAVARLSHGAPVGALWPLVIFALLSTLLCSVSAIVTVRASDRVEIDGIVYSIWLAAALLVSPITWSNEITLIIPLYLFVAAYVLEQRVIPADGFILLLLGVAGFILPYYSTPMRRMHLYFVATVLTFAASCLLALSWSAWEKAARGGEENPSAAQSRAQAEISGSGLL